MRAGCLLLLVACGAPEEHEEQIAAPAHAEPPGVVVPGIPDVPRSVPLMGGTLEAVPELEAVLASLPSRGQLVLAKPEGPDVITELGAESVPFRLQVEGQEAWVSLRGTGEVAHVAPASGEVIWRAEVCAEPRGLAHTGATVLVACAGGELVELSEQGELLRSEIIGTDLRDVVVKDGVVFVSRFRAAEVLILDPVTWAVHHRTSFPEGGVMWRMRPSHDRGVVFAYQLRAGSQLATHEGGYAATPDCSGPSQGTIGMVDPEGNTASGPILSNVPLPVDLFVEEDGSLLLVDGSSPDAVRQIDAEDVSAWRSTCFEARELPLAGEQALPSGVVRLGEEIVLHAVESDRITLARGTIAHAALVGASWWHSEEPPSAPFHLFHTASEGGIACVSCHPEATDDGRVWSLAGVGFAPRRRTMTLAGGVSQRAPYHWLGELDSPSGLMQDTFMTRMRGRFVGEGEAEQLFAWLDGIRPVRATVRDTVAILRGEAVFQDASCDSCHAGPQYTNNQVVELREGVATKVPTLQGLGLQEVLMHDGCADSIEERLTGHEACTGTAHGDLTGHTPEEIEDLAAFLRSL